MKGVYMSHIGCKDDDWTNYAPRGEDEDLFYCEKCELDFALESDKIEGKFIQCPVCHIKLKPHQKRWNP